MGRTKGSWSVASTVLAPKAQIDKFLSHYLSLGADRIFVFLDDQELMAIDDTIQDHRVLWFSCDPSYWADQGFQRPEDLGGRQIANVARAALLNQSEWLLHVDSDELVVSTRAIHTVLADHLDDVFSLLIAPLEAVYLGMPSESFSARYFKRVLPPTLESRAVIDGIYGDLAELTHSGFFGHTVGKSFIRTQFEAERYTSHTALPKDPRLIAKVEERRIELLHFDANTFDDWIEKFVRRIEGRTIITTMSKKRLRQIERIQATFESEGMDGLRRLFEWMHILSVKKLHLALASGFVVERLLKVTG